MAHEGREESMDEQSEQVPMTARVQLGQHVLTRDEHELGIVGRTTSKQFEVNAPSGGPCWLERQAIIAAEGPGIVVGFPYEELPKRRLKASEVDVTEGTTFSEIEPEGALSPAEALQQRERMERQLTEQRAGLAERGDDREGSYGESVESELAHLRADPAADADDRASEG